MFKAVLCEVGYAKRHVYLGNLEPFPSALKITSFRLAITLIPSPVPGHNTRYAVFCLIHTHPRGDMAVVIMAKVS